MASFVSSESAGRRRARGAWLVPLALLLGCASPGDHAPALSGPVPEFGAAFIDLTETIEAPFVVPASPPGAPSPWIAETAGLFADLDGDGVSEVILMLVTSVAPQDAEGDIGPKVYRYTGDRLELQGPFAGGMFSQFPFQAIVDLDADGQLDVLAPSSIAWGTGGGAFEQPTPLLGGEQIFGGITLADLDSDGWLDMLIGQGSCAPESRPLVALMRTGPRAFERRDDLIEQPISGRSFAAMAGRIEGQMTVGTLFSACVGMDDPPPFYRREGDRFAPFPLLPPQVVLGAPMGAALGDLDGDGIMELAITDHDDHRLFTGGSLPLGDVTDRTGFGRIPAESLLPMIPWTLAFLDFDRDGRLDVVVTHGNDFGAWFTPGYYIGPQWTTAHWNQKALSFTEVDIGLGRQGQWKVLTTGDLDGDGDADLAIGGGGEVPRVYRNDVAGGNGLTLRLRGSTSNPLGIGALVEVWPTLDAPEQRYVAGAMWAPDAVSEPLVFVGLGDAGAAELIRVTWPSGTVQEMHDVAPGKIHVVEEPAVVVIDPPGRHLPADGASIATVHVTPRNPDGTARAAAVDVEVQGDGAAGAVVPDGDGWMCAIVAPASPGSGVITVTIDGAAVAIAPRLWWD